MEQRKHLASGPPHIVLAMVATINYVCRLLAQMRSTGCAEQCLNLRAKRKAYIPTEFLSL
jgi:hypothetical protein